MERSSQPGGRGEAGAASTARVRVTSVGARRHWPASSPLPAHYRPGSHRWTRLRRAGPSPALSRTPWCLRIRFLCEDVIASTFSANTASYVKAKKAMQDQATRRGVTLSNF